MCWVLQLSSVSRKLAAACANVFVEASSLTLLTDAAFPHKAALDSSLFRSLAPRLRSYSLHESSYTRPGLPAFLAAASPLQDLTISCSSALAAAQADHLLPSCRSLWRLVVHCTHIPCRFPPGLQQLVIHLGKEYGAGELPFDSWQPSVLIWQLADLTSLESLNFSIKDSRVVLDCPLHLPKLERLSIEFDLGEDTVASLSWLRSQPCTMLDVSIRVCTAAAAAHQALVDELRQIPITGLTLYLESALSAEVQTMWKRVRVSKAS